MLLFVLTQTHHLYRITILPPRYQALICKKISPRQFAIVIPWSPCHGHSATTLSLCIKVLNLQHAEARWAYSENSVTNSYTTGPGTHVSIKFKKRRCFSSILAFQLHLNGVFRYQKRRFSKFFPKFGDFFKTLVYRFRIRLMSYSSYGAWLVRDDAIIFP